MFTREELKLVEPEVARLAMLGEFNAEMARRLMNRLQVRAECVAKADGPVDELNAIQGVQHALATYAKVQETLEANQGKDASESLTALQEAIKASSEESGDGDESGQGQGGGDDGGGSPAPGFGEDGLPLDLEGLQVEWQDSETEEKFTGTVDTDTGEVLKIKKDDTGRINQVARSSVTRVVKPTEGEDEE